MLGLIDRAGGNSRAAMARPKGEGADGCAVSPRKAGQGFALAAVKEVAFFPGACWSSVELHSGHIAASLLGPFGKPAQMRPKSAGALKGASPTAINPTPGTPSTG